jgi:hypothetical protein
VSVSVDWGT